MKTKTAIILLAIILSACGPAVLPAPTEMVTPNTVLPTIATTATQESALAQVGGKCLPPITEFDIPIRPGEVSDAVQFAPPPAEWIGQTRLPEKGSEASLQFIEHHPGYDVIWVESGENYFRFRTDTQQWSTIPYPKNFVQSLQSLFQDKDGRIWAAGIGKGLRFLYLSDQDRFEIVNVLGIEYNQGISPQVFVSRDNLFWFLIRNGALQIILYSFDPKTGETRSHLTGEAGEFSEFSIAMGQDGSIFLLRPNKKDIVRYYPDTDTTENIMAYDQLRYVTLAGDYGFTYLFVDGLGNLWIGDYAWIDFSNLDYEGHPIWHQIIRSSVFIARSFQPDFTYIWWRPRPMLQSSDGRIWFDGRDAGLVWLDPHKGIWCKFTTINSKILEDGDGNLWLLYDSNLYKYSIASQ